MNFKELIRLNFRPLSDADRDVYADVNDPEALIAYSHDETWIIEGELLRVVRVHPKKASLSKSRNYSPRTTSMIGRAYQGCTDITLASG